MSNAYKSWMKILLHFSAIIIVALAHVTAEEMTGTPKTPVGPTPPSKITQANSPREKRWGFYTGKIQLEFDPDGRKMIVLNEVRYTDPLGVVWIAPAQAKVDGASIPEPLWSFVGGPFEGLYRDASVFHDVACELRRRTWQSTHRMFYEAMRCSGVGEKRAKLMYFAVTKFGPRWAEPTRGITPQKYIPSTATPLNKTEINRIQAWIDRADPSLEKLDELAGAKGR